MSTNISVSNSEQRNCENILKILQNYGQDCRVIETSSLVDNKIEKGCLITMGTFENKQKLKEIWNHIKEKGKYIIDKKKLEKINVDFLSARMSEEEVLKTIKDIYDKYKTILDPHTAIGYNAFDKVKLKGNNIVLATAHPCKFPDAIKKSINQNANLPKELMFILDEKENYDILDNNLDKIKNHIKERIE